MVDYEFTTAFLHSNVIYSYTRQPSRVMISVFIHPNMSRIKTYSMNSLFS